jgi:phosphate transport system protein
MINNYKLAGQLRALEDEVLLMGNMVEKAVVRALDALKRRDLEASRQVIRDDDHIDRKRYEIEDRCINLIATQAPVARDLRHIIAILHITTELERMGDYAEGIGKISVMMGEEPPLKPLIDVPRMAEKASQMLKRALDALVNRDVAMAFQVCSDDDEVDALYDQVYRELLMYMIEDPKTIKRATYLLWVAHDLERVADRATNVAERVIYLVTGKFQEINVSKY